MARVLRIAHLAIATNDLDQAVAFWRDILGLSLAEIHEVPQEQVRVAFFPLPGAHIELVQPTQEDTGVARFLRKRGPGMHHVCLEVDDLEEMLTRLKAQGVQLIHETPQISPSGRRYAFLHPRSTGGVLVELYQAPPQFDSEAQNTA